MHMNCIYMYMWNNMMVPLQLSNCLLSGCHPSVSPHNPLGRNKKWPQNVASLTLQPDWRSNDGCVYHASFSEGLDCPELVRQSKWKWILMNQSTSQQTNHGHKLVCAVSFKHWQTLQTVCEIHQNCVSDLSNSSTVPSGQKKRKAFLYNSGTTLQPLASTIPEFQHW